MNKSEENVYIQAYDGKFLCADNGCSQGRPILANREAPSDWERFAMVANDDGTFSLRAHANGKYLSAEIDTDGRLNARADQVDAWEKFWVTRRADDGRYVIQSCANMKFVSIDPQSRQTIAKTDVADEPECFNIVRCDLVETDQGRESAPGNVDDDGNVAANVATSVMAAGGVAACATGVTAAVTAATASASTLATIGAIGTGIGGTIGGLVGAGVGIATGGTAIAGTIPCAIGGAALGGSAATAIASTCASALGIATAPAWAVPVAICGGVAAIGAGAYGLGRFFKWW